MDSFFIKNNRQDLQDHQDFFIPGFRKKLGIPHPLRGVNVLILHTSCK
jgi:hypothetical protein